MSPQIPHLGPFGFNTGVWSWWQLMIWPTKTGRVRWSIERWVLSSFSQTESQSRPSHCAALAGDHREQKWTVFLSSIPFIVLIYSKTTCDLYVSPGANGECDFEKYVSRIAKAWERYIYRMERWLLPPYMTGDSYVRTCNSLRKVHTLQVWTFQFVSVPAASDGTCWLPTHRWEIWLSLKETGHSVLKISVMNADIGITHEHVKIEFS